MISWLRFTNKPRAIQNLKIDKITVWDSGGGNGNGRGLGRGGTTADFLSSLIGSLPAMHELAEQAGIELPTVLGRDGDAAVVETKPRRTRTAIPSSGNSDPEARGNA